MAQNEGKDGRVKPPETDLADALEVLQNVVKMVLVSDAPRKDPPREIASDNPGALEDTLLGASLVANFPEKDHHDECVIGDIDLVVSEVRQYIDVIACLGVRGRTWRSSS